MTSGLSPVSTWEALLLNAKGRVRLHGGLAERPKRATAHMQEARLTHEIVLVAQQLPLPHPDPADRFMAATAQVLDLTPVTADERSRSMGTALGLALGYTGSWLGNHNRLIRIPAGVYELSFTVLDNVHALRHTIAF
jgi:PIN domain nuclease of toxin-antitoxin system